MKDYPEGILPIKDISKPNEEIEIYNGSFWIEYSEENISVEVLGRIYYKWFPYREVYFEGHSQRQIQDISLKYTLRTLCGNFLNIPIIITSFQTSWQNKYHIVDGIIVGDVVFGDVKALFNVLEFSVLNFRDFQGDTIKFNIDKHEIVSLGRIELNQNDYKITIDKHPYFRDRKDMLIKKGGYHILYSGKIYFHKKQRMKDIVQKNIRDKISYFLSFINQYSCGIVFMTAINNQGKYLWTDYTTTKVALGYKTGEIDYETNIKHTYEFNQAWEIFCKYWETDCEVIKFLIDWYNEAAIATLEVSIIHIQIAFELFFNWYIVEKRKIIDGDSMNAENKIRLLLHEFNIDLDIPNNYINLKNYISTLKGFKNTVKLFVEVRNNMIHANDAQIKQHQKIPIDVLIEIRALAFSYLHQALCKLFGFKEYLP